MVPIRKQFVPILIRAKILLALVQNLSVTCIKLSKIMNILRMLTLMENSELYRDEADWYQFIYYLRYTKLSLKYYSPYIKIIACILELKACFAKLIKFPHPRYFNREALSVATRFTCLKAHHYNLLIEGANAYELFDWYIALDRITLAIIDTELRCLIAKNRRCP